MFGVDTKKKVLWWPGSDADHNIFATAQDTHKGKEHNI